MMSNYWIFDWLDEQKIGSLQDAERCLNRPHGLEDLANRAHNSKFQIIEGSSEKSLVAGAGLDLGYSTCCRPECIRSQVDELFGRAWHYFDQIILCDTLTPILTQPSGYTREQLIAQFLARMPSVLYIREVGAEQLVHFQPKIFCMAHIEQHALEQGLQSLVAREQMILDLLSTEGRIMHRWDSEHDADAIYLEHPDITSPNFRIPPETPIESMKDGVIKAVLYQEFAYLTADVGVSRKNKAPLGCILPFQGRLLALTESASAGQVLFHLKLPVLGGVSPKALIEIRQREAEHFDRFRASLRVAVRERLSASNQESAIEVAEQIRSDIIEPALASIRQRLVTAERLLSRKAGLGLVVGSLATACGLLAGVPVPLSVGAGSSLALQTIQSAGQKYLEEKRDVALEGMYFLWKAQGHAHGN